MALHVERYRARKGVHSSIEIQKLNDDSNTHAYVMNKVDKCQGSLIDHSER